ncbi:hypothetical protein PAXRUDRAFT_799509 [Paxillus rubicundulus Ve08.2h10]|uniref:Yeast cell wall synthesis Kre9/Knh1-like N-terminal domain-containing protein n=1 Tax=Paxillus rubicundulus Ve08.2h10 TaxID=930991 RepID=A0A0D0DXF7_9AGAM|nr:hypothetical protein PAXRUDRAFT_799509 [Paxillus rubicundulus Ve08.2h10]
MFATLTAFALALRLVSAMTVDAPVGAITGSPVTLTWAGNSSDPAYFTLELTNPAFRYTYAIANNVQTSEGSTSLTLPQVPVGGGYTLLATATEIRNPTIVVDTFPLHDFYSNVNQVYGQSSEFSIGAPGTNTTTTTTASSTTAAAPGSPASTGTVPAVSPPTAPVPSSTAASSSTTPSSSSSSAVSSFKLGLGVGPAAAVVLSAVAGAVMVF